jgi:hypothetical protein
VKHYCFLILFLCWRERESESIYAVLNFYPEERKTKVFQLVYPGRVDISKTSSVPVYTGWHLTDNRDSPSKKSQFNVNTSQRVKMDTEKTKLVRQI